MTINKTSIMFKILFTFLCFWKVSYAHQDCIFYLKIKLVKTVILWNIIVI